MSKNPYKEGSIRWRAWESGFIAGEASVPTGVGLGYNMVLTRAKDEVGVLQIITSSSHLVTAENSEDYTKAS